MVTTYSAANTTVTYAGHSFEGFGAGDDVISVARREDGMQLDIGMQGDGVYSQSTDKSGTITIRLLAGSATNDFLNAKVQATDAGAVFSAPLIIKEEGSSAGATAARAVISKQPDFSRGNVAGEVEWVFLSDNVAINHAGSEELA